MALLFSFAEPDDAVEIAALRCAAADQLTREFGRGQWSSQATDRGVLNDLRTSRVLIARDGQRIVGTLRLATKKPWAIDTSYFSRSIRPLYLSDMAVHPGAQRTGVGRRCLEQAAKEARRWPADAIRLDAYDAAAGAGEFYVRCGYREVGRAKYRETALIYFELLL